MVIRSFSMTSYLDSFTDLHAICASVLVFFFHIISYHKNYYSRVKTFYIFPEVLIVVISQTSTYTVTYIHNNKNNIRHL